MTLAVVFFFGLPTNAQEALGDGEGVSSQILWTAPGPSRHITLQGSDILDHKGVSFGVMSQYYRRPLGLRVNGEESWVVKRVTGLDFSWAVGLGDRFQIGMVLPVVLEQYGKGAAALFPEDNPADYAIASATVGDLRFHGKTRFFGGRMRDEENNGFGMAVDVGFSVPSGDEQNYSGENGLVFAPSAVFDFQHRIFATALDVGVRLRSGDEARLAYSTVGNQFVSGLGVTLSLLDDLLRLSAEANFLAEMAEFERIGVEIRGGIGLTPGEAKNITWWLSGGGGLSSDPSPLLGVPQVRFLLGFTYSPRFEDSFF